ncbi:QueT transporter family protein [uncultured Streptococcus sp.]|uniref:QueT transporter family protein n=1 Tax=uncultured Streptococcus sp. TaxID=83427 RepID=UPI0025F14427|nr:QueT transporter family protein [uncultured Streptococcus sp.]
MKTKLNTTQKLVLSAIMMALYIAILFVSQAISFGAVQMRLATALYGLTYIFPFLVVPFSLANAIANSLGGLGLIDVVGGFCASFLATGSIYLIRKIKLSSWFIILPILFVPSLVVPIWLSVLLKLPYVALVINLILGQLVPAILGAVLVRELTKRGYKD